jgi:hypothetical protein
MDEADRMALDEISLPVYEEPTPRRRRLTMSSTTNNNLTGSERDVLKNLNISGKEFLDMKIAQQENRENTAGSRGDETRTVFRAFGSKQEELLRARTARMSREGAGDDKQLSEKLGDLIHHINLASDIHVRHNGSPSISLMCASRLAGDLQTRLNGADESDGNQGDDLIDDKGGRVSSHARMPDTRKIR